MEQQNPQPIQEKTASKPPVKTNWKFIAIAVVLGLLIGGGLMWYANFVRQPIGGESHVPVSKMQKEFSVEGTVQFTELEGGCWFLLVDKERGDAVKYELTGIEKSKLEQYRNQKVEVHGRIQTDRASMCQIGEILEAQEIKLLKNTSVNTSSWQTYRNSEFGFEMKYPHTRYQECAPTIFSSSSREESTKTLSFVGMSLNFVDAKGLELNEFVTQYRNKLISELRPMEGKPGFYWGENPGLPAKTSLGGREALEVVSSFVGAYPDTIYDIFVKQDEKIFIFSFSTKLISKSGCVTEPTEKYKPETLEALAKQILSTFRFIENKASYIKVISPNGGEKWVEENTYDITWKSLGVEKVNIMAATGGKDLGHIAFNIDANLEKYSWKIPAIFVTGFGISESDDMKIRIYDAKNPNVFDENDNYFTLRGNK